MCQSCTLQEKVKKSAIRQNQMKITLWNDDNTFKAL